MRVETLQPVHPGEVLEEEFLKPFGLSDVALADGTHIRIDVIKKITSRQQAVTADIALRLGRFFGTSAHFWLGLQSDYDLDIAKSKIGDRLQKEIIPLAA